jgi:hypothetical protein
MNVRRERMMRRLVTDQSGLCDLGEPKQESNLPCTLESGQSLVVSLVRPSLRQMLIRRKRAGRIQAAPAASGASEAWTRPSASA